MANIMSMQKLRNTPSRNGFDLSCRLPFTCNTGEVNPVFVEEIIPGDDYEIDTYSFVRSESLNSSAHTRIREYYDFVFVPTNLMWNKFNTFISQMDKNNQSASGINMSTILTEKHPFFTLFGLLNVYCNLKSSGVEDMFGRKKHHMMRKLLWYCGYPDLEYFVENGYDPNTPAVNAEKWENEALNPFYLLAYQKAYSDYIRNSIWEESYSPAFNLDYISGETSSLAIPLSEIGQLGHPMFELRYANWNKDLFMGLLPSPQFGNSASIDISNIISPSTSDYIYLKNTTQTNQDVNVNSSGQLTANGVSNWTLNSQSIQRIATAMGLTEGRLQNAFSILQLRKAEAEQKFREITQSVFQDYQSQMEAHWDVKVSDGYSSRSILLGGIDGDIQINAVTNTNLADDNAAVIRANGVGANNGRIKFSATVHGYLVCIHHVKPQLDYALRSAILKPVSKVNVTDYAIPEFDKIGMDAVNRLELYNGTELKPYSDPVIGYAPRYYEYKQNLDRVRGGFVVGQLQNWIAPLSEDYFRDLFANSDWTYRAMKVSPDILNPIFAEDAPKDTFIGDQFQVVPYFDIKAVRKLDRNGLPY